MTTVTGYMLKEQIKRVEMVRDTVASLFDSSLHTFEGEDKDTPREVVERYRQADLAMARLQTIQTEYNLRVKVEVEGQAMTLCEAIKQVGGAGRVEKMWRSAAGEKKDRYSYRDESIVRSKDEVRASRTLSKSEALELATAAAKRAGALRAAIATGNAKEINLDVSLPDF